MKKYLSVTTLLIFIINITACSFAGYKTHYQRLGIIELEERKTNYIYKPNEVAIHVQQIPAGFIYKDGMISVDPKYPGNKILGEISIEPHPAGAGTVASIFFLTLGLGFIFVDINAPPMHKNEAIDILSDMASESGGNAVINAVIPKDGSRYASTSKGLVVEIVEKHEANN